MLLSDSALARIIAGYERRLKLKNAKLEKLTRERQVEKESADTICKSKVAVEQAKYQACTLDRERQRSIYERALKDKKCPHPAWHYISFIGGSIVAGGICAAVPRVK